MRRRLYIKNEATFIPIDSNTIYLLHGNSFSDQSGKGNTLQYGRTESAVSGGKFGLGYFTFSSNSTYLFLNGVYISTNFTVEFWMYQTSISQSQQVLVDTNNTGRWIVALRRDTSKWIVTRTTVADDDSYKESTTYNAWVHVAFTFDGAKYNVFRNGKLIMSSTNLHPMDFLTFGENAYDSGLSAWKLKGYISELRVSNKVRWTSNFTPPSKAY